MMRALVIDDEFHAREQLSALLEETKQITVVGKPGDAVQALSAIRREKPDVIFLDVQMPAVSGFELLGMLGDGELPEVVFVTAHEEFALQAFEKNAVDYLLKPVSRERLAATLQRLQRRGPRVARPAFASEKILRVPCQLQRSIKLVPVAEIELARSSDSGVHVLCAHGEYATELTLQVLEARAGLLRCHKQYLVNSAAVDQLGLEEQATVRTRSGLVAPVSRRYLALLREQLGI
jgi:two-component system, LytTR family, response regulator